MIEELLPFYERESRELAILLREFGERYPHLAGTLGIVDGACEDPSVQRIVESVVMLGARILRQLEDSYPQFTESLLHVNYPHFVRPFPSTSIAAFAYSREHAETMNVLSTVAAGTIMKANAQDGVTCQFRSVYPVSLAPVILSHVAFEPVFKYPPHIRPITAAVMRIDIECVCPNLTLGNLNLRSLRVFIDGEPSLRATLRDILFMNTVRAYVEVPRHLPMKALEEIPITPVGFAEEDAMLPCTSADRPGYRLFAELFAAPEKFNFFDIDLEALVRHLPSGGQRISLFLAIDGIAAESDTARIVEPLSNRNLRLACTPVVNLFDSAASPIDLTCTRTEYPLLANAEHPAAHDIFSVDSVRIVRDSSTGSVVSDFHPYYSMRHGVAGGRKGNYFAIRRDELQARTNPGRETMISLVDIDLNPLAMESVTASVELTCTNRDLPALLRVGAPSGDLKVEQVGARFPIHLLRKPSPSYRYPAGAHWRLIAQLSLNHRSLVQEDLEAFTEMLALHDLPQSPATQRQIRGIVGIAHRPARAWLKDKHGGARVHGTEVIITLDETAYVGSGLHAFIACLDHFLALYTHLNTFTQLTVLAMANGQELMRCKPRCGNATLV